MVLDLLRRQGLGDPRDLPTGGGTVPDGEMPNEATTHRSSDDVMAMSIDDGKPGAKRDGKTRREVR